ncbi:terminase [Castellaniella sp. FW104-16D08]|uniref:terminase n=1 Tax=unclassified Castellaniella TaxID=2617606 RepID=UPI003314C8D6
MSDPDTHRKPVRQKAFLAALASCGVVGQALAIVDLHRSTVLRWRKDDPEFAAAYDQALEDATDTLESEARRRAVEGVDEPVYYKGERVGAVRRYSDKLMEVLLKGNRPDKFKDRVEHSGSLDISIAERLARARGRVGATDGDK